MKRWRDAMQGTARRRDEGPRIGRRPWRLRKSVGGTVGASRVERSSPARGSEPMKRLIPGACCARRGSLACHIPGVCDFLRSRTPTQPPSKPRRRVGPTPTTEAISKPSSICTPRMLSSCRRGAALSGVELPSWTSSRRCNNRGLPRPSIFGQFEFYGGNAQVTEYSVVEIQGCCRKARGF